MTGTQRQLRTSELRVIGLGPCKFKIYFWWCDSNGCFRRPPISPTLSNCSLRYTGFSHCHAGNAADVANPIPVIRLRPCLLEPGATENGMWQSGKGIRGGSSLGFTSFVRREREEKKGKKEKKSWHLSFAHISNVSRHSFVRYVILVSCLIFTQGGRNLLNLVLECSFTWESNIKHRVQLFWKVWNVCFISDHEGRR